MPKRVDHQERREQIAEALLQVVIREGLEAVSLRHVAAEAGVTAGLVQHYFPSKDSMIEFAMATAGARYEQRIVTQVAALGDSPDPAAVLTAVLGGLLPANRAQLDDARIALAFQSYAAGHPAAADRLAADNALLRRGLAELITAAVPGTREIDRAAIDSSRSGIALELATALHATAEGLAIQVLCAALPPAEARRALDRQIRTILKPPARTTR